MERNLRIRRSYVPRQYETVEITDEFTGIPEAICLDEKSMKLLTELLLLKVESAWQQHLKLRHNTRDMSPEEIIALTEDNQNEIYTQLAQKGE